MSNYYTKNNYISNSSISEFIRNKEVFKKKYIDGEEINYTSDALTTGSVIDCILTEGWESYNYKYEVKVLKKNNPFKFEEQKTTSKILITEAKIREIEEIASSIEQTPAFQQLKNFDRQMELYVDYPINEHFTGLKGKPDFVLINKKTNHCTIIDLKSAREFVPVREEGESIEEYTGRIQRQYYYKCKGYGYFRQLAMYRWLIRKQYGIENFWLGHLTVEKEKEAGYPVYTFQFTKQLIDNAEAELFYWIEQIKNEKLFLPPKKKEMYNPLLTSWKNSIIIDNV